MGVDLYRSSSDALALPWVDSPFFDELLGSAGLDSGIEALVRHYAEHGYVVIDPEIPAAVLDSAISELRDRYRPGGSGYYSDDRRIQDAWNFSEPVRRIATAPKVLEILRILYRRPPVPFQTLNFRIGSEQRTHSDAAFFDSMPHGYMAGVWVALEEIDGDNGPLRYYPQSHRLPMFNLHDLGVVASAQTHELENVPRYEDFVEALIGSSSFREERLHVRKGEALIWAANLYHGGSPILDPERTRFSQVTHYYFGGCLYYTPLTSDPAIGRLSPRRVFNVENGRLVPQFYHGRAIENPGEWPPRLSGDETLITDPMQFPTRAPRSLGGFLRQAFGKR